MKIEHNFCYAETSKLIWKLGIRWSASHFWALQKLRNQYVLRTGNLFLGQGFPAYNITELGHMIPFGFFNAMKVLKMPNNFFKIEFEPDQWRPFSSEAEGRAHYLLWLIETGKVEIEGKQKKEFVAVEEKPVEVSKPKTKRTNAKRAKVQPKLEQ